MKILHSADWHIGPFPGPEKNGVNLREQDTYNCIDAMIETARQENPNYAVISGDIFHTAKVWSNRCLNETHNAIERIEQLSKICPVAVLYGTPNHDLREQFTIFEDYFKDNERVTVITSPRMFKVYIPNGETLQICALPGFDRGVYRAKKPGLSREEENQVFTDELNSIVIGLASQCVNLYPAILISHYTVPGCNMESGQVSFFSQAEPVILPETLATAGFDLVALGHIHSPQAVTGCRHTYYSGAINAFNFNDEGQERGFWIHELHPRPDEMDWKLSSRFYKTPYREFITFKMDDSDITEINKGAIGLDAVARKFWGCEDRARNKIVRILYACTDENNKAFNKSLLEKRLYDDGAFWVSEIVAADIAESLNKEIFIEDNSPEDNLRDFLSKKKFDDKKITSLIEAARPIIAEALAISKSARFTGVFEPVEIEVSNYRNYETEKFNFKDITFCTINGGNGAGKSSLFMDAVLDCLYEEPREGELTGWINNNENAKSGSITFTFKIGEKIFRVTRTRSKKTGKATLNLSELMDGEWCDRSKEKIRDTQDEIINILGMDSLTFKSCALIMQDQYDIFLQANKKDRMSVLASLLGLSVYEDMEAIAKNRLSETNKQISHAKAEIDKLSGAVVGKVGIEEHLKIIEDGLGIIKSDINAMTAGREVLHNKLSTKLDAAARALKHRESIAALENKKTVVESSIQTQESIVANAALILAQTPEIQVGIKEHAALLEQEKTLLSGKATFEAKQREQRTTDDLITSSQKAVESLEAEKNSLIAKRKPLETQLAIETALADASIRYQSERQHLSKLEKNSEKYIELSASIEKSEKAKNELHNAYTTELAQRVVTYRGYEEKTKLLKDTECIDVANAKCKFLADAKNAAAIMGEYQQKCISWKESQLAKIQKYQTSIDLLTEQRTAIGYDPETLRALKITITQLESLHMEYERLGAVKEQISLIDERMSAIDMSILEAQKKLADAQTQAVRIAGELATLKIAADEYDALKLKIIVAAKWLEKEKLLPVAKEQKDTAEKRIGELKIELSDIAAEIFLKQEELNIEMETAVGSDEIQNQYNELNTAIDEKQAKLNDANVQIGAIRQQLADIAKKSKEITDLQMCMNDMAESAVIFEELKIAFSQDGIPHNIIRSIVPLLAAKANNILGQMTGGRMGLEFKTDKVLESNKKEVVTLDILIEEYGKGKLPYLSKSGGEKVKAALSAILALAEIKTTRSGIQLGMLFIDEPPFLDSDGIQAYCDALEAIRQRYRGIKIMAITHDPTMKARFPQSIDVVKTENGSKVILG